MPKPKKYVSEIEEEVKASLKSKPKQSISHGWDHLDRVRKRAKILALKIMEESGIVINVETLEIACLAHDLNESYEGKKTNHVANSVAESEAMLQKINCPKHSIQNVLQIISEHSSEDIKPPSTIEAQILFDADKLDGLGAIGIARVFALCGQQGLTIKETVQWYRAKIKKAIPYMQTAIGKKLAAKELKYVLSFLKKIEKEQKSLNAI